MLTHKTKKTIATLAIAGIMLSPALAFAKDFHSKFNNSLKMWGLGEIADDSGISFNIIKPNTIYFGYNNTVNSARKVYDQAIKTADKAYQDSAKSAKTKFMQALQTAGNDLNARLQAYKTYLSDILAALQQEASAKQTALSQFISQLGNVQTNNVPTATAQSVTVTQNIAKAITLAGTDPENHSLTYSVVSNPSHGTLSGTAPSLTYTPASNYTGSDSFTFKVNDGTQDSATATVSITVVANQAPVATSQNITITQNTAKAVVLTGTDAENSALTYTVLTSPTHGTLSGIAPNLSYLPSTGYTGADSFTFKVNDGTQDSATATVSITVQ